jgi:hypothetical protein
VGWFFSLLLGLQRERAIGGELEIQTRFAAPLKGFDLKDAGGRDGVAFV